MYILRHIETGEELERTPSFETALRDAVIYSRSYRSKEVAIAVLLVLGTEEIYQCSVVVKSKPLIGTADGTFMQYAPFEEDEGRIKDSDLKLV